MDYHEKPFGYASHYLRELPDSEREDQNTNPNFSTAYAKRIFGGTSQQKRMIQDKLKSLDRSVLYSYQAATIKKQDGEHFIKALINPDKLKADYDDKILSVRYESEIKAGDIIEWVGTSTYWLVYLQDLDEKAYFRSEIRRCLYLLRWKDEFGVVRETYAAERGPVETKIDYIQKVGISVDNPNHSLHILMPYNEYTGSYFKRYAKFYVPDAKMPEKAICWRVEAFDSMSTPGILEITAVEYYANEFEDDTEQGIVKGKLLSKTEQIELIDNEENIIGPVFIRPKKQEEYKYLGQETAEWLFDNKLPIQVIEKTENSIVIKWVSSYSGQFTLQYGDCEKTIVVESLF